MTAALEALGALAVLTLAVLAALVPIATAGALAFVLWLSESGKRGR